MHCISLGFNAGLFFCFCFSGCVFSLLSDNKNKTKRKKRKTNGRRKDRKKKERIHSLYFKCNLLHFASISLVFLLFWLHPDWCVDSLIRLADCRSFIEWVFSAIISFTFVLEFIFRWCTIDKNALNKLTVRRVPAQMVAATAMALVLATGMVIAMDCTHKLLSLRTTTNDDDATNL